MCDYEYDYTYTTIDPREPRARKQHTCCACDETIEPGQRYRYTACISDHPDTKLEHYKHCLRCARILDAVRKERPDAAIAWRLDCGEDWLDTIGELPDNIAALAFMTADEAQKALGQGAR